MKEINFKNASLGLLTETSLKEIWGEVSGIVGIAEGRCAVADVSGEHVLQVTYPKGKITNDGNVRWSLELGGVFEEYTVEYKVMVSKDFDFVRGGKLPGLFGGSGPAGGASVIEADGFSARIMWRELGVLCQYVYYVDKGNNRWGDDFLWTTNLNKNMPITKEMWKTMKEHFDDRMYLKPGTWHTLKTYIKMNTLGKEDGKIISWLDGVESVNLNLKFRNDESFGIDRFKFTTFFGGNDDTWAPAKDEIMYFKDFKFSSSQF
jgi:hypothetical protein